MRLLHGDQTGGLGPGTKLWFVASNGIRTEVAYTSEIIKTSGGLPSPDTDYIPQWATLGWWLRDDPAGRPDWGRLNQQSYKAPNKISKKDQT
jgi:hypothetical protein